MNHKDPFLLDQIIEHCDRILAIVTQRGDSYDCFRRDLDYQELCSFKIEHIGDLVNSLSDDFKENHPEIEWRQIVGMRNIIAHDYGSVDLEIIWSVIKENIPELRDFCTKVTK